MIDRPAHAQLLLALRKAYDWTQRDLAAMLGVSLRSVQRWENGEVDPPSYLLSLVRLWLTKNPAEAGLSD